MAIATTLSVQFKCGHSEVKDLSSTPPGKRKTKALGVGRNFVCSRYCKASRRDESDKHHQDQLIQAQGFDEDHGLSGLAGSDKQALRATRLCCHVLTELIDAVSTNRPALGAEHVIEVSKSLVRAG